jgi:hypothetical protein
MTIQKIKSGRVNNVEADNFVGDKGTIFFNESVGDLRISDGTTIGGIPLTFGGGDGGNYTLPTASTTIKGGVKIDGSTIAINNQVISVGTVPYSSLSGTPTIPTNNNQLSNGAGYITSSALTGLASETYVTTRGYLTTVAYADVTGKPTLFSGSYADLTNKPTIPTDISQLTDATNLLGSGGGGGGTTYITNNVENPFSFSVAGDDSTLREISNGESIKFSGAGGVTITTDAEGNVTITGPNLSSYATQTYVTSQGYITSSALTGLATESYVTSRGYITGLSWDQLTNKPNLASTYTFNVAADDSTLRTIGTEETVKFIGAGGITTASDAEGAITITQGTTSSLVNGAYTVSLGSDGVLTIPANGLIIASTGPYGQQHEMRLGDGLMIGQDGGLANYKNVTWSLNGQNSDSGTQIRLPGQTDSDNGLSLLIQHQYANSSIDIESLGNIWSFRSDGALTFPDTTVQTTAWTGVADYNNLINKPNLAGTYQFSVAADDSTQRLISTDEVIKFTGAGGITTSSDAEGAITITGPSLAGLATETFVTTRGYITGLSWDQLTNKPNLAGTYSWAIAADDSTQITVNADNVIKFVGGIGIDTVSDANGNITINGFSGSYTDLTDKPTNSALNANGTLSMPLLSAQPANLQAGQIALANGTSWDPQLKNENKPYLTLYTGAQWVDIGGLTASDVYKQVLELT